MHPLLACIAALLAQYNRLTVVIFVHVKIFKPSKQQKNIIHEKRCTFLSHFGSNCSAQIEGHPSADQKTRSMNVIL